MLIDRLTVKKLRYIAKELTKKTDMIKKTIMLVAFALVAVTGWAQTKVWNEILTGYANTPAVKVTKVEIYNDRTEVSLHIDMPKQVVGQRVPIAAKTILRADGKEYAVKGATVISLNELYTVPADGKVDFSLIFDPIPANTWIIDVAEPDAWNIANVRDAKNQPVGIANTYWRNETTGDWMIGFTSRHVIFDSKVWDIVKQEEKKDAYTLTLENGKIVKVGKMKKGKRTITIDSEKPITCSPITGTALPEYPTKDLRTGFVDNGYNATDSVTIIGWLKDMPEEAWKRKGREFNVEFMNIINVKQESAYTAMDSLGRFTLRMPLLNTSQVFLDWGRTTKSTVLEPGKTYFFLNDFKTGQTLWMGDDVRLQNELLAYPHDWPEERIEHEEEGKVSAMDFKARTDSSCAASMAKLQECIVQHPNLSQRYIDYVKGYYQTAQAAALMRARFAFHNYELPQEYMEFVGKELWQKSIKPYTLYREFPFFMRDYLDHITSKHIGNSADETVRVIRKLEQQGVVTLTNEEKEALEAYIPKLKELETSLQSGHDMETIQNLVNNFNEDGTVLKVYALFERIGEPFQKEMATYPLRKDLALLDSVGSNSTLRDICIARNLYIQIEVGQQPLPPALMEYAEQHIQMPYALNLVKDMNEKMIAIQDMDLSKLSVLKPNEDVANMSDGEKILRKIIEPYKGKIILLDIWGTWCGPCREALSHSQEEYERLKDFDIIYLYLANGSTDEGCQNVIKQYNVTGDNVVHYNLPEDQQSAIENFLNVHSWPTYKLFDRNGNLLDLEVSPSDLEGLARLLQKL